MLLISLLMLLEKCENEIFKFSMKWTNETRVKCVKHKIHFKTKVRNNKNKKIPYVRATTDYHYSLFLPLYAIK